VGWSVRPIPTDEKGRRALGYCIDGGHAMVTLHVIGASSMR
jgi:hypothetical protein